MMTKRAIEPASLIASRSKIAFDVVTDALLICVQAFQYSFFRKLSNFQNVVDDVVNSFAENLWSVGYGFNQNLAVLEYHDVHNIGFVLCGRENWLF